MCCPLAFLPNELRPQKCKILRLHSETPSSRTATNLTLDRCSVQSEAFECLNCTHTLCCFPYSCYLQTKEFIWIKCVQCLNFNRRSVSGLEPERLINLFQRFALLPFFHLLPLRERHRQRMKDIICTCFCYTVCCCHLFTSNNLVNFINQITAILNHTVLSINPYFSVQLY